MPSAVDCRRKNRRLGIYAFSVWAIVLLSATLVFQSGGFYFNGSASFPRGVYRLVNRDFQRGDLVIFSPPNSEIFAIAKSRGYFSRRLLKRVSAVANDVIAIDNCGVTINGKILPRSAPQEFDRAGRNLPRMHLENYRLRAGEILLISDYSPRSFDSRYFGAVNRDQIIAVVEPFLLFE